VYNLTLAADPDDPETVIAGGVQLYRSTDGGTSFSVIGGNVHVDHHAAAYEPGSTNALWVGSDGGLWRSTDDGSSWTGRNTGLITYQFYDVCVNRKDGAPYYVMGGTQDNGTDKWSGTSSWSDGLGGASCGPSNSKARRIDFLLRPDRANFGNTPISCAILTRHGNL